MANKEEMEALGIVGKRCKECCRDITEEEYKGYKGYCRNCYRDRYNIENKKKAVNNGNEIIDYYENDYKVTNMVAKVIKILAIIEAIVGVILGIYTVDGLNTGTLVAPIIVASLISAVFIYALGEIIQLLEDIKNKN